MLPGVFYNPPGPPVLLGVPLAVVVLGLAIVVFVVGVDRLWRITRGPEVDDPDARAERYRDRFR